MKQYFIIFYSLLLLSVFACEGPVGPPGLPGPPGPKGNPGADGEVIDIAGTIFEIVADFNSANEYATLFQFPADEIIVLESDVVLVYLLWEVGEDSEGNQLPIWRLMPQTIFLADGSFQYNYDYTYFDVSIFLDGAYDFTTLGDEWRLGQTFRIVVIPAYPINPGGRYDFSNYEATIRHFGLEDAPVKRYRID